MFSASKGGQAEVAERWEPGYGDRKVQSEDFYRFGSGELDGDLRRALAQFCEEAALGIHRARGGSCGTAGGSVAVYAVGPDGADDAV